MQRNNANLVSSTSRLKGPEIGCDNSVPTLFIYSLSTAVLSLYGIPVLPCAAQDRTKRNKKHITQQQYNTNQIKKHYSSHEQNTNTDPQHQKTKWTT
jgi:hypothetical protein